MTTRHREPLSLPRVRLCLAGLALLAGCASKPPAAPAAGQGWIKDEVADSYVFGFPLVLMDMARSVAGEGGGDPGNDSRTGANTLRHAQALPSASAADASDPPTPDVDTLASSAWLDLAGEPVVVTLPDTRGRYLDARALDMWSNVIWSTGASASRRGGTVKEQTIAFVPPGWDGTLPAAVKRIDAPGSSVWLMVRIQSGGPRDLTAVKKLQRAMRIVPLSVYTGDAHGVSIATRVASASPTAAGTPAAQVAPVAALDADAFFGRLAAALGENPPSPSDPHALKILADLGVKPGKPVKLPANASAAIEAGLAEGRARLAAPPVNALSGNGWSWLGDGIGSYGNDYVLRGYAAYAQSGSGTKDDEVLPMVKVDSDGQALNGDNRYMIHFAPNALPPARAFWTITPYTADGALPETAKRGAPRRSIGSRDRLQRNRDGSIDIYVSATSPGGARAANWLPVPHAEFRLVMRLFAPAPQATDGSWQPPAVVRQ